MLRISLVKGYLQNKGIGVSIIAASGVVLVLVAVALWGLSRGSDSAPQVGTVVLEVSVPQEITLTEYSSGSTENGTPLEMTGSTVSLAFRGGYMEAIDLPVSYSSGQDLASFSDAGAGIYIERDGAGLLTLRFPLLSNEGGMPLTVTGTVETIQPQAQSSMTRFSLGHMEAEADISIVQAPAGGLPSYRKGPANI